MKLIIATQNEGKAREIGQLLAGLPLEALTLAQAGFPQDIDETADTYAANALLKAAEALRLTGLPSLGDDSGLEVDALGGRPGLYTARYAPTVPARWEKLLGELKETPWERRTARFVCAIALAAPGRDPVTVTGECDGQITFEPRGSGGFGYDPLFFLPEHGCTMAELPDEVKNRVSHRARAALRAREILQAWLAA